MTKNIFNNKIAGTDTAKFISQKVSSFAQTDTEAKNNRSDKKLEKS